MPRQLLGKNSLTPRAELDDSGNAFPLAGAVRKERLAGWF
jgi:hypothetical protein